MNIAQVEAWIARQQAHHDACFTKGRPDAALSISEPYGAKYLRIQQNRPYGSSVWCFIDRETGDILKAEGWKKPAKGARGHIDDGKLYDPYGGGFYIR